MTFRDQLFILILSMGVLLFSLLMLNRFYVPTLGDVAIVEEARPATKVPAL